MSLYYAAGATWQYHLLQLHIFNTPKTFQFIPSEQYNTTSWAKSIALHHSHITFKQQLMPSDISKTSTYLIKIPSNIYNTTFIQLKTPSHMYDTSFSLQLIPSTDCFRGQYRIGIWFNRWINTQFTIEPWFNPWIEGQ